MLPNLLNFIKNEPLEFPTILFYNIRMKIKIHYVDQEVSYIATCLRDCKRTIDESIFLLVSKTRELTMLGNLVGEPIYD
jgi:hypothetical protein